MSDTPKERLDTIADELIGRVFAHYEHPSLRPISEHDFIIYDAARQRESRLRERQHDTFASLERRLRESEAEVAALREDAERYRWLREPQDHFAVEVEDQNENGYTSVFYAIVREELDAAIDAARKGKE